MSSSSNGYGGSNSGIKPEYVYDIPFPIRHRICRELDNLNLWEDLAVNHFGFEKADLQRPRQAAAKGNSPSDELLNMWGDYGNHKIIELFVVFSRLKLYDQMEQLKSFVDRRYHSLIKLSSNNFETKSMKSGTTNNVPDLQALLQSSSPSIKLNNLHYSSNIDSYLDSNSNSTSSISNQHIGEGKDKTNILNSKEVRHLVNQITIPRIDYNELKEATNDFNPKNSLGKGGFGYVYKGVWKKTPVAIKRLLINEGSSATFEMSIKQILNELKFLNSCRHDNILSIYGYSIGENPCLVYQLMDGGSLHDRLRTKKDNQKLSWSQRFTIAKETARGIQYLHTFQGTKPLIHGDIKPANILLDKCCQPKIGDFGLVREGVNSSVEVSAVYGTRPYLPQEYLISKSLSTKIDTYSFGIVLLEIVTALKVYDDKRQDKHLIDHVFNSLKSTELANLIDKNVSLEPDTLVICEFLVKLGNSCVTKSSRIRPEMVDITTEFDNFYLSDL